MLIPELRGIPKARCSSIAGRAMTRQPLRRESRDSHNGPAQSGARPSASRSARRVATPTLSGVGFRVPDDELPLWLRVYNGLWTTLFCLALIGFGISYIVLGHTAGRIVGIILVVSAAAAGSLNLKRRFANRNSKPSL